jgi:hypothetical protein
MEPHDQPGEYKKLEIKQYAPRSIRETAENKFWKKFKAPVIAKQVRIAAGKRLNERA